MKDFSELFTSNESSKKLSQYFSSVCGKCKGMCCTYNMSPVDHNYSLKNNLTDDTVIILKKALILSKDYRKRFFTNVSRSLRYFEKKGYGKGLLDYVKRNKYSLKTIFKAYRLINEKIERYNEEAEKAYASGGDYDPINDCLFLIPGWGCIMEEYRPYTCITAFRKCFKKLDLFDFVESKINDIKNPELLGQYLKEDFRIDEHTLPKIIIGASHEQKKTILKLIRGKKTTSTGELTYKQLALLADFITFPFMKPPECLKGMINQAVFYIFKKIKDPPPITFVESITPGEKDDSFEFGLDFVQVFKIITS